MNTNFSNARQALVEPNGPVATAHTTHPTPLMPVTNWCTKSNAKSLGQALHYRSAAVALPISHSTSRTVSNDALEISLRMLRIPGAELLNMAPTIQTYPVFKRVLVVYLLRVVLARTLRGTLVLAPRFMVRRSMLVQLPVLIHLLLPR
jgi:hypothetical protein